MTTIAGSGHPTSCLSAAEIISTLFFHEMQYNKQPFNPNNDEFILSKGHAAPILYSALKNAKLIKNNLNKLRKLNSKLEGHPIPKSIKQIKVATGSLGQGLSVAVGMALAAKLQKRNFRTYTLLGDSEVAEGAIYEALELADHYKLNNLTIIVDINRLGQSNETMLGHDLNKYKKRFQGFNINTIAIEGHEISQIKLALNKAKKSLKPTVILAKTIKGKGVSFLENKERWHGKPLNQDQLEKALKEIPDPKKPKFKLNNPKNINFPIKKRKLQTTIYNPEEEIATREAYGNALANLSKSSSNILAVDAEVSNSTKSDSVKALNQEQFIEAYIAEQNMAGMAFGLSIKDFNVFASTFSAFLTRAHDQIRMIALSSPKSLTFCGSHSGVSIGPDGASQMGLEDIALFRNLPNSIIFSPSDAVSTEKLTALCSKLKGLKYLRTTRPKVPVIYPNKEVFKLGDFKVLKESKNDKVVVIGTGITTHEALKAYNKINHIAIIDLYCIKPLNKKKLIKFINNHGRRLLIVEDHYPEGGIGEMLAKDLENTGIKIKQLAINEIPHSGTKAQLLKKYKIDSTSIIEQLRKF